MQDRMLQFFAYSHLPSHLQAISKPFGDLAQQIVGTLPGNPERTVALRKLLEAKDCAVRASLYVEPAAELGGGGAAGYSAAVVEHGAAVPVSGGGGDPVYDANSGPRG